MAIDVELEGFTGPLDLLCHLVENREIEAASISVSELVRAYATFLQDNRRIPINTLAEFMALAARLMVGKLKALFPVPEPEVIESAAGDTELEEENIMFLLRRYRPYRNAAQELAGLLHRRECHFSRAPEEGPAFFDLGDLYSLSFFWWKLAESPPGRSPSSEMVEEWDDHMPEGVPDAIPEGIQVDLKMEELRDRLSDGEKFSLRDFIDPTGGRPLLIVTLLALLELSRLGEVNIRQKEVLGDVRFEIASCPVKA